MLKPTRGRVMLWAALAFVWLLFLPQDLAMDPQHRHFSWIGAAFWVVVLAGLLLCCVITWQRVRRQRD